jgi:hypothetical protein
MQFVLKGFFKLLIVTNARVLKSIPVAICIGACSLAQAASLPLFGLLDVIIDDQGGAVYSGVPIGTAFSGVIDDETFSGIITDGTTDTVFSCCIAAGGLGIDNDVSLSADDAALINTIGGTNYVAGDIVDAINIEGDATTAGAGRIEIGTTFILDASAFDDDSLDNYPPNFEDIRVWLFFIFEEDSQGEEIYSALGAVDVDFDGIPLIVDNCIGTPNADQADHNGDGVGNVCDPAFATINSVPDVNSNGFADIAVIVGGGSSHVHIRDGNTDELISDIDFGDDPVTGMAIINDISGNGMPEVALLGRRPNDNARVQVKDSITGTTANDVYYGSTFFPQDMTVIADTDGNGADELAVLGVNDSNLVRVLARDSLTDAATSTTYYGNQCSCVNVLTIPDLSGNDKPELLVHGRMLPPSNLNKAKMRDSSTGAFLRDLYFGTVYIPIELVTIDDVSGDGIEDVAELGRRFDTGLVRVLVRATDTGATITTAYAGFTNTPIAVLGISDTNGNNAADLAILVMTPAGTAKVIVRDGATGTFIRTIFATALSNPVGMTSVQDMNANGSTELAILGDGNSGTRQVKIKDSSTGSLINTIDFP